jgi:5-methylcytosine-specific restriction endonuclease McrA
VAFVEGSPTADDRDADVPDEKSPQSDKEPDLLASANPRYVSLKLRLKVLQRDRFCCVICGRSPAVEANVQLHIDHVLPFSCGGKTSMDNL